MKTLLSTATFLAFAAVAMAQPLTGPWDATVQVNGVEIPFRMEFSETGGVTAGAFFNGEERVPSTRGSLDHGALTLYFDHYATRLEAQLKDGLLEGRYGREAKGFYPFRAQPAHSPKASAEKVPSIAGRWEIPVKSPKGESAWLLVIRQKGEEASGAILRVDGDTGTLTGRYHDGKFVLSHFSGARPMLLEVTPAADGSLELVQNGKTHYTALRSEEARARNLPAPTDPSHHTSIRDANERFAFSFPDVNGKLVSNTDARFTNKVVIVAISGSWCPNCHDEAPFLSELYRNYHQRGLEVVSLSFEEAEQLKDPVRLKAFIRQYNIEFPVLIPGEPSELAAKIPQAVNLNAWPTTFYLGRDGRVKSIHAGFAGRASGEAHSELKAEVTALVEELLATNTTLTSR